MSTLLWILHTVHKQHNMLCTESRMPYSHIICATNWTLFHLMSHWALHWVLILYCNKLCCCVQIGCHMHLCIIKLSILMFLCLPTFFCGEKFHTLAKFWKFPLHILWFVEKFTQIRKKKFTKTFKICQIPYMVLRR
jgi:hypothetical protein